MKRFLILLTAYAIFYPGHSEAALSKERVEAATEYLQWYRKDWSVEDTEKLASGGYSTVFIGSPHTSMGGFTADDGRQISVMITGNSILVDGKYISGQLGSKTTYGTSSPIIEDVRNSQISTAPQSP